MTAKPLTPKDERSYRKSLNLARSILGEIRNYRFKDITCGRKLQPALPKGYSSHSNQPLTEHKPTGALRVLVKARRRASGSRQALHPRTLPNLNLVLVPLLNGSCNLMT